MAIPSRTMTIAGVVLMALGLVALVAGGITYTSREAVVDIGPLHATADTEKTLPLRPAGIAAVAGGIALLVVGRRKRA